MNENNNGLFIYNGSIPGSAAEESGLKVGDTIISINGVVVYSIDDWNEAIASSRNERNVEVLRDNKLMTINFSVEIETDKKILN